jgi:hypothetical protein
MALFDEVPREVLLTELQAVGFGLADGLFKCWHPPQAGSEAMAIEERPKPVLTEQ